MSDVALRMEHVYKKFRKGETYNSLRDLLPALTGKMFRGQELNADDKREFWALAGYLFRSQARRSARYHWPQRCRKEHRAEDPEPHHEAHQGPHDCERAPFCAD